MNPSPAMETLKQGIAQDDLAQVGDFLRRNPDLLKTNQEDMQCLAGQALTNCRSTAMADLLLEHGAGLNHVTEFWAPGFWLTDVIPTVAEHLIQRGATVTPHAAAGLGLAHRLAAMLDDQPELVHAKGGDGGRPLHFSRNVEIAGLLLDRGAEIDPRDDDHDSTPAQWRIGDAPEVTRFLLQRGASPDIFMAAGLGDLALAERLVAENPACTTYRIGHNNGPFPGIGFQGRGGTIYQWSLGFNQSPHEVALHRGHRAVFDFLMSRTPPRQRFLIAAMRAARAEAGNLAAQHPGLVKELDPEDLALLAKSCWETNLNEDAVRVMLDLGFPVDAPEFNHGYKPLHNAAWCGHAGLVELLIQRGHPVNGRDPNYQSTPLGFAVHSYLEARRHPEGDFSKVVRLLLQAGSVIDEKMYPTGHAGIDEELRKAYVKREP